MKCDTCGGKLGVGSSTETCPECLRIILANSVPEPTCERCEAPLGDGKGCKPRLCVDCTADDFDGSTCEECGSDNASAEDDGLCPECRDKEDGPSEPEDEDLVTSDYVTFYRAGMNRVAFSVWDGEEWQEAVRRYMEETEYWPDVWREEERGGYTNISMEVP